VRWALILLLLIPLGAVAQLEGPPQFRVADGPWEWDFPRDHGAHPGFGTEWWYFTGSLLDSNDHRFGYELTFFRVGLRPEPVRAEGGFEPSPWRASDIILAHFAVTEVDWNRFHLRERSQRAAAGIAGADTTRMHVWIANWSVRHRDDGVFHIQAREDGLAIDLELVPQRPLVLHGENGLSHKTRDRAQASYYYSMTRLQTRGTLTIDDDPRAVSGMTWMDQEFFSGDSPRDGFSWDWFSARFADGRDLMLGRVRRGGVVDNVFGTVVEADGSSRPLDTTGAVLSPGRTWTSPWTDATYPVSWTLEFPAEDLQLEVEALVDGQEVHAETTVGFSYWEGLSRYEGTWGGRSATGEGYVELTGYDDRTRLQRADQLESTAADSTGRR